VAQAAMPLHVCGHWGLAARELRAAGQVVGPCRKVALHKVLPCIMPVARGLAAQAAWELFD
jgi:hypothetical protein